MADEEVVVRFVADTSEAIKNSVAFRQEIDKAKEQLRDFSKKSGAGFDATARAMKEQFKSERMAKIPIGLDTKAMKEALAQANKDIAGYNASVRKALSEVQSEEAKTAAVAAQSANSQVKSNQKVTQSVRETAKAKKDAAAQSFKVDPMLSPEQVKLAREQIALARDQAKLIQEQAKASNASRSEKAKADKLEADAQIARNKAMMSQIDLRKQEAQAAQAEAKAVNERAKAYKTAAEAYVAPQQAKAQADQASARATEAGAKAQAAQANATIKGVAAANAGAMAQQKLAQAQARTTQAVANATNAQQRLAGWQQRVANGANGWAGSLGKLNGVLRLVFGTALGITAVKALRDFRQGIIDATKDALEFNKSQFALALALREIQRRGGEVDFDKVKEEIDSLYNQFGVFSKKEILQSFTDVSLRLSRFGATADQVGKIVQTALVLKMTDVEGRFDSVADAAKVLATYLGSGYGEGLERAGAIAGRSADQLIAFENGMKTLYGTAIDPLQRAMLRIDFVFRQFSGQMKDAAVFVETAGGRIEKAESRITDATVKLGGALVGPTVLTKEGWANFVEFFVTQVTPMLVEASIEIIAYWDALSVKIGDVFKKLEKYDETVARRRLQINQNAKDRDVLPTSQEKFQEMSFKAFQALENRPKLFEQMSKEFPEAFRAYRMELERLGQKFDEVSEKQLTFGELVNKFKEERRKEFSGLQKEFDEMFATPPVVEGPIVKSDKMEESFTEGQDELTKILKEAEKDRLELEKEFWDDMGQVSETGIPNLVDIWSSYFSSVSNITVQGTEDMQAQWEAQYGEFGNILNDALNDAMDIWRDYYDKIADIGRSEMQDIADENREYAQRLEDAARDEKRAIADANRKYRDEEIKAERDYQEKLRRLREEFLFDLEDALRERDALQVLRLMRRYALDKAQAEREKDNDAKQRAEDHKRELEDIRRNAAEKRQELATEHARRLEDIRIQAEREREEAAINRDRELQALKEEIEQKRHEREEEYKQAQQDLQDALTERIKTIIEKLKEEGELTDTELTALEDRLTKWATNAKLTYLDVASAIHNATIQIVADIAAQNAALAAAQYQNIAGHTPGVGGQAMPRVNYQAPTNSNNNNWNWWANYQQFSQPSYGGFPGTHALGGTEFVNKPTLALFGEGGPEIAHFMPINKLNTNSRSPIGSEGGIGNSLTSKNGGRLHLMLELSPDLEARIVDNTLDQSAEIIESALGRRLAL